jgi:hypothetical protein
MKRSATLLIAILAFISLQPCVLAEKTPAAVTINATKPIAHATLKNRALIHTNREYCYENVPKELQGLKYTMHQHKNTGTLQCEVKSDGLLRLCLELGITPKSLKIGDGWVKTGRKIKNAGSGGSDWTVYAKQVKKGEKLQIPSGDKWGSIILAKTIDGCQICKAPVPDKSNKQASVPATGPTSLLQQELNNRKHWNDSRVTSQVYRPEALITEQDKTPVDVILRRTEALLEDISKMKGAPSLTAEAKQLAALRAANDQTLTGDDQAKLFGEIATLRRTIAFKNPLIGFKDIAFIKHHRSGANHMCDQYHGHKNKAGGGVFVLRNAFSDKPEVRDLLMDSPVTKGRLKDRLLDFGSFISLEVSYDAKTMLFAHVGLSGGAWTEDNAFHIFKCNADGSGLVQLTDGPWNEFDPCFLPNGRIVFISERIGGFGRCHGRPVPTYTLHSMLPDGNDIITLSWHDTNEWHPSVDNNGMIIYSRWDYVDRDSDIAHHIWHTFPDGRDPRSYHGNYPDNRRKRPWMELSCRSIPGSHKYISTAAPHHGQAYGSLITIDMNIDDDREMSQLKRVTPDVMFPESEGGKQAYGNPWALSEDYYICVFDPRGSHYGIYLVDSFGNRILLYRDPSISCLDPIPLVSRKSPPIIPPKTIQAKEDRVEGADMSTGIVTVMNVYEGEFPLPKTSKITELRIVNIFPKATPSSNKPNIGYANQSLARGVLGTVPVEADGSAHFKVPTGIDIYFQALDEDGMVVQTMRSGTYVHPGETLACIGCHEHKRTTPSTIGSKPPTALRRAPSDIKPGVDGSYPLSYARLVQPVLNAKCVGCHDKSSKEGKKAPNLHGDQFGKNGWSKSFEVLHGMGWGKHGGNGSIRRNGLSYSIPNKVCARVSKLYAHLTKEDSNCDIKLTREEILRITMWIDCNSNFYGAYLEESKQAKGEVVIPTLGTPPWGDVTKLVR